LDFDSTLKVVQKNVVSLIREQIAFEVYAKGVGLVHKKIVDISTQSGISTGTTVEMKATEYGFN
jgi:type III secretion system FlhB-like substrate exporter